MKIFGVELKFNGFDIWHSGNFNPASKSDVGHSHVKANITDFPSSLPANGGNADTVDGKHASDFQQLTNGGAYGIFPSTASTMVGNEYNILHNCHKRDGVSITQSGTGLLSTTDTLFDGRVTPNYSSDGIDPSNPFVLLITGLPNVHTQTGGVIGWTSRYWYPSKYKIEAYDSYNSVGWKTIVDQSIVDKPTKELLIPIYPTYSGSLTQLRITIYESSVGSVGANGFKRWGLSEIFFIHPEAMRLGQYLDVDMIDGKHASDFALASHTHTKSQITDMPTKLSEFINDIGAGSGVKITTSSTAPTSPSPGDFWYKEI